jgi:hypothetical protein
MNDFIDLNTAEKKSGIPAYIFRWYIRAGVLSATAFAARYYLVNVDQFNDFVARYRAGEFDGRHRRRKSK